MQRVCVSLILPDTGCAGSAVRISLPLATTIRPAPLRLPSDTSLCLRRDLCAALPDFAFSHLLACTAALDFCIAARIAGGPGILIRVWRDDRYEHLANMLPPEFR